MVVDVETGGVHPRRDALLELAAVPILRNEETGLLSPQVETYHYHIEPFVGANIEESALEFNKIIPDHPFREAVSEKTALDDLFKKIKALLKKESCSRAILIGHNAWFDLHFLRAAADRCRLSKQNPFHPFTSLDTATLSMLAYHHSVLAEALKSSGIGYSPNDAHSAIYDAQCTAKLFCQIFNEFDANQPSAD